jgi:Saxitoxin biosynthesis operon protein SxtJ
MIEINRHPSRRNLLVLGTASAVVCGVIGVLRWHGGAPAAAYAWWIGGVALMAIMVAAPRFGRWLYVGWMYATYPIAWTVSHLILGVAYYLVATPIGLTMRLFGRDPLGREFDKSAQSYWIVRTPNRDDARYFRQF